jgi:hypothetical protein
VRDKASDLGFKTALRGFLPLCESDYTRKPIVSRATFRFESADLPTKERRARFSWIISLATQDLVRDTRRNEPERCDNRRLEGGRSVSATMTGVPARTTARSRFISDYAGRAIAATAPARGSASPGAPGGSSGLARERMIELIGRHYSRVEIVSERLISRRRRPAKASAQDSMRSKTISALPRGPLLRAMLKSRVLFHRRVIASRTSFISTPSCCRTFA